MTEGILLPLVSVVITTKNEQKNIEKCLESIALQKYPSIEIIVVDNNSIDNTKKIICSKVKNCDGKIDWKEVFEVIEENNGMPAEVGGN